MSPVLVAEPPCADCGYAKAAWSDRLGRHVCGRHYFGSIPKAEREASDRAWARRDLAGQVRAAARRLDRRDPRSGQLQDLAFDLELGDERDAAGALRKLRSLGGIQ